MPIGVSGNNSYWYPLVDLALFLSTKLAMPWGFDAKAQGLDAISSER